MLQGCPEVSKAHSSYFSSSSSFHYRSPPLSLDLCCSTQFCQAHEQIVFKEKSSSIGRDVHGDPDGSVYDGGADLVALFMAH